MKLVIDIPNIDYETIMFDKQYDARRLTHWVICMESTKPNTEIPSYEEWEYILIEHGYVLKEAHGINRFYIDAERKW